MADTTTATATAPAPVVSANIEQALASLVPAITNSLGVSAAALQSALDQHAADQQTIASNQQTISDNQAQLAQDQADLTAAEKQIAGDADAKTAEDAALTAAEQNQVSPATITAIDNVTNALNAGLPIPAGGIPTGPIPPITQSPGTGMPSAEGTVAVPAAVVTVGSTVALPTDPTDPSSPTVDHTVTAIGTDGTISATPAAAT